jgi:hypothetical protein
VTECSQRSLLPTHPRQGGLLTRQRRQQEVVGLEGQRGLAHALAVRQQGAGLGAVAAAVPLLALALLDGRLHAGGQAGAVAGAVGGALVATDGEGVIDGSVGADLGGGGGGAVNRTPPALPKAGGCKLHLSLLSLSPSAPQGPRTTPANQAPALHWLSPGSSTASSERSSVAAFQRGRRSY